MATDIGLEWALWSRSLFGRLVTTSAVLLPSAGSTDMGQIDPSSGVDQQIPSQRDVGGAWFDGL
jgi:hypothetical protein